MPLIRRKHATVKAYVHDWLEPDQPGGLNFFSGAIIFLVTLSLASLALETEAARGDSDMPWWMLPAVQTINFAVVWIFAAFFSLTWITSRPLTTWTR